MGTCEELKWKQLQEKLAVATLIIAKNLIIGLTIQEKQDNKPSRDGWLQDIQGLTDC